MRTLLQSLLLLSLCVAAHAGSLITATITVTGTPADGDTITVNGSARTWKTAVATPASQLTIGASIGENATNMFAQFAGTPFTTLTLNRSGTNGVTLRGIVDQTITVSIGGTWGTYSLTTNTVTPATVLLSPMSAYPVQSTATNVASNLANDLGTYSTNKLANGTKLLEGLVQTNGTQTVNGTKTFTGANTYQNASQVFDGGTVRNVTIQATNSYFGNAAIYGTISMTNDNPLVQFYDTDGILDNKGLAINANDGDFYVVAFSDDFLSYSYMFYGRRTGTTIDGVVFPTGEIQVGGSGSTSNHLRVSDGTQYDKYDLTTLANGNNANVSLNNKTFVRIPSGPTGAFTINGIAGGANGSMKIIYNSTGQNMTIANDSGVDPTPGNRIYTNTGADITTTGNGCVTLIYDSSASRWIVTAFQQ